MTPACPTGYIELTDYCAFKEAKTVGSDAETVCTTKSEDIWPSPQLSDADLLTLEREYEHIHFNTRFVLVFLVFCFIDVINVTLLKIHPVYLKQSST